MSASSTYQAYASGLASHPEGQGGYSAVVIGSDSRRSSQRAYRQTTTDRMAIMAATDALRSCPPGSQVHLHLKNRRVYDVVACGKLEQWRLDHWKARVGGNPIKDADLWLPLDDAVSERIVTVTLATRDCDTFGECVHLAQRASRSSIMLTDAGYRSAPLRRPLTRPSERPTSGSLVEGDPCPRCQSPVRRHPVRGQKIKPGQRYRWAWLLRCNACGARYQTREGRRTIDSYSPAQPIA